MHLRLSTGAASVSFVCVWWGEGSLHEFLGLFLEGGQAGSASKKLWMKLTPVNGLFPSLLSGRLILDARDVRCVCKVSVLVGLGKMFVRAYVMKVQPITV
jgi:hypothetical protein